MATNLFSRIIAGVDRSDVSTDAVRVAARLAHANGGELVLFHAVDWYRAVALASDAAVLDNTSAIIDALREEGSALLDDALNVARDAGVEASATMADGDPVLELLNAVDKEHATLLVTGTHGRSGIGRMVLGSTAEGVLRGSTIPVLTVRESGANGGSFRRVLVALDDSEPSDAALDVVLALPPDPAREVSLCTVVTQTAVPANPIRSVDVEKYRFGQAQALVDRGLERARQRGVAASGSVDEGRPDEIVVSRAIHGAADTVVVGSHGRRGLQRFFLGSVAERIVRTAPMPVLVVRPPVS